MKTCKHGSGRGGEKRTEKQRARRLLHQKNGAIVRQVVGYDHFVGEHAYPQLTELYQTLRLYINLLPALHGVAVEGTRWEKCATSTIQRRPHVSRLLLSGSPPAEMQQELTEVARGARPHSSLAPAQVVATGRVPMCPRLRS